MDFAAVLALPHGNSLGRVHEVVEAVLAAPERIDELLVVWRDGAPWTRLRAASSVKRVAAERPELVADRLDLILGPIAELDQPSARWTVAQLCERLADYLQPDQRERAVVVLQASLTESDDWIVLNCALSALAHFAGDEPALAAWLAPHALRLAGDRRKSVAKRAVKVAAGLGQQRPIIDRDGLL